MKAQKDLVLNAGRFHLKHLLLLNKSLDQIHHCTGEDSGAELVEKRKYLLQTD